MATDGYVWMTFFISLVETPWIGEKLEVNKTLRSGTIGSGAVGVQLFFFRAYAGVHCCYSKKSKSSNTVVILPREKEIAIRRLKEPPLPVVHGTFCWHNCKMLACICSSTVTLCDSRLPEAVT